MIFQHFKVRVPYQLHLLLYVAKNRKFAFFGNILAHFKTCHAVQNGFTFLFLDAAKPGEHFSYPHDVRSMPRNGANGPPKNHIFKKKIQLKIPLTF